MPGVIPPPRSGHVSVAINNTVIIWGGYSDVEDGMENERYLSADEIWLYYLDIDQWCCKKTSGSLPTGLSGASAVVDENFLYVLCGHGIRGNENDIFKLNLSDLSWDYIEIEEDFLKPSPRDKFAAWLYDNKVFIFGGYGVPIYWYLHDNGQYFEDPSTAHQPFSRGWNNQLLYYDLRTGAWTNPECSGAIPSARAAHASVRLEDAVYVFGGRHNETRLNDLHKLDLNTLTWVRLVTNTELPVPRTWHTLTQASDQHLFLYGGYSQHPPEIIGGEPLGDAWLYDTIENSWKQLQGFQSRPCLWHTAVLTADQTVVIFGGCVRDIFTYDGVQKHTNGVVKFRLRPKSLQELCFDAAFMNRMVLSSAWPYLPRQLMITLADRLERFIETNLYNESDD